MCADVDWRNMLVVVSTRIENREKRFFLSHPMTLNLKRTFLFDISESTHSSYQIHLPFSWLCCYMAQMNPLIGPRLHQNTILIMAREWGNPLPDADTYSPEAH
jgi:ATP synthase subunit H